MLLSVENMHVHYGRVPAVRGVSIGVGEGEIVCVVGPNGAGKSTTLLTISGVLRPTDGTIAFDGASIVGLTPEAVARRGISQVPEGRHVFTTLSVEENLRVAAHGRGGFLLRQRTRPDFHRLFPTLADKLDRPAAGLSGGEAQVLALARGLEARPRLLLLDEPSLGLSPKLVADVFDLIRRLREEGLTILMVEQNVGRTLGLADRAYVLESGRIALEGSASELLSDSRLVATYLGMSSTSSGNPT